MAETTSINAADAILAVAAQRPDHPALVTADRELTYGQLAAGAAQRARALSAAGLSPGGRIGIALRDASEAVLTLIGIWLHGSTAVFLDNRSRPSERVFRAREFGIAAILEDAGTGEGYLSIRPDADWQALCARQDTLPPPPARDLPAAMLALTSGTTGAPLGVLLGHDRILFHGDLRRGKWGRRFLCAQPISFRAAQGNIMDTLLDAGTVVFFPAIFRPGELIEAIEALDIDETYCVPTVVRGLLTEAAGSGKPLLGTLDRLYVGGAGLPPDEKLQVLDSLTPNLILRYSSSLTGNMALLAGDDIRRHTAMTGRVSNRVRMEIVGPDGSPLPPGTEGHIRVRSPSMATATVGGAGRSGGDRLADGWAIPGDMGILYPGGLLELTGRAGDLIIRGGANVHPAEIEAAMRTCPGLREVVAFGFASAREGQEIAAMVVADPGCDAARLTAHARAHLSPDRRPRRFLLVDAIPVNANGKVSRRDLAAQLENGPDRKE